MNRLRPIATIAIAAVLPLVAGCSKDDKKSPVMDPAPASQPAQAPNSSRSNVPFSPVPASVECGFADSGPNSSPEDLSDRYLLIADDGQGGYALAHSRLPLRISVKDGSSQSFRDAIESSLTSIGSTVLPVGSEGEALVSYPGKTEGEFISFVIRQESDGSFEVTAGYPSEHSVAIQSEQGQGNLLFTGEASLIDAQPDEFKGLDGGNGAFLREPLTDPSRGIGVAISDTTSGTGCVAGLGSRALEIR